MKYLFLISFISASQSAFLTKSLTLVISFSTTVKPVALAKLLILGLSFLTLFILALREALVA